MLVFRDYEILVIQDYRKKRTAGVLPLALIEPTPGRLRDECLAVCKNRYNRKDERTLRDFFGDEDNQVGWLRVIARYDLDKFKPLGNFLREKTDTTDDKNIELLAWLIDFQPRPFIFREYVPPEEKDNRQDDPVKEDKKRETNDPAGPIPSVRATRRARISIAAVALLLLIVAAGIGFYGSKTNKPSYSLTGHEACMFWDEDHYQPISCKQHGDTLVVALDSNKLLHFRKITQPDTITTNSIGTVWYVKYRKGYEFYTSDGSHPIDPQLRLRPITEYIIRNHVRPE